MRHRSKRAEPCFVLLEGAAPGASLYAMNPSSSSVVRRLQPAASVLGSRARSLAPSGGLFRFGMHFFPVFFRIFFGRLVGKLSDISNCAASRDCQLFWYAERHDTSSCSSCHRMSLTGVCTSIRLRRCLVEPVPRPTTACDHKTCASLGRRIRTGIGCADVVEKDIWDLGRERVSIIT